MRWREVADGVAGLAPFRVECGAMSHALPRLYVDLAPWYHLLTDPSEYVEEAAAYREALLSASEARPRTLLELGSGGGNNVFHLKREFGAPSTARRRARCSSP